ncbi:MAG: hypothetical protein Q8M92_04290, partial [Candidatus Subteraquimicrobiales bacterium]|nr:hypothetical protein [Candidatus Subteraquimicrobiales bacterium]
MSNVICDSGLFKRDGSYAKVLLYLMSMGREPITTTLHTIGDATGVSRYTVKNILDWLEKSELIKISRGKRDTSISLIFVPDTETVKTITSPQPPASIEVGDGFIEVDLDIPDNSNVAKDVFETVSDTVSDTVSEYNDDEHVSDNDSNMLNQDYNVWKTVSEVVSDAVSDTVSECGFDSVLESVSEVVSDAVANQDDESVVSECSDSVLGRCDVVSEIVSEIVSEDVANNVDPITNPISDSHKSNIKYIRSLYSSYVLLLKKREEEIDSMNQYEKAEYVYDCYKTLIRGAENKAATVEKIRSLITGE